MERFLEEKKKPDWNFTDILLKESKREFVQKIKRGEKLKTRVKLSGVDTYWKSLIRHPIYGFYSEKLAPILDRLQAKLIRILKVRIMNFITNLNHYITFYRSLALNIKNAYLREMIQRLNSYNLKNLKNTREMEFDFP